MNPITHALVGWSLSEAVAGIGRRERTVIVLAGISPDLDGLGIPVELLTRDTARPLLWWSEYHHVLCHNLVFTVIVSAIAAGVSRTRKWVVGLMAFAAAQLHLLGDLAGSRGPDGYEWPIPYLYPFSDRPQLVWSGQWALNAWPNFAITIVLLAGTLILAWHRGYSPVGLISHRADSVFVQTLRTRFPRS